MKLYGRHWTRREIEQYVGRIDQIGGVTRFQQSEGYAGGTEIARVRTGAGLSYDVTLNKGFDISLATFQDVPLSWQSPNGNVHPAYYDSDGISWLRTASGGLLMTCGLLQVGADNVDQDESLGVHGRIHHTPAEHLGIVGQWAGDDYEISLTGTLNETRFFAEKVSLRRQISSRLGENTIRISDTIRNNGFHTIPHMILYHFNFGFPLLMPQTEMWFPSERVTPRDEGVSTDGYDQWELPQRDFTERVYRHEDLKTVENWAKVEVHNPVFPIASGPAPLTVRLQWDATDLDRFIQWKNCGAGEHVLGIEPSNCYTIGRAKERLDGTLQFLEPGEERTYSLTLSVEVS